MLFIIGLGLADEKDITVKGLDAIQTIELFGDIAGMSFDESGDSFWISNADDTYGCLLEFIRSPFFP